MRGSSADREQFPGGSTPVAPPLVVLGVFAPFPLLQMLPVPSATRRNNRNRFEHLPADELLILEVERYRIFFA